MDVNLQNRGRFMDRLQDVACFVQDIVQMARGNGKGKLRKSTV